ncbi:Annexin-B12 [Orbilia brochopaga]|nr:Annexin-B12 [Drechslerella brochopaga]
MSRREYDDYGRDSRAVEYVPARPRSRGSNYGPPGGFPESPKESYMRAAQVVMPHAPAPPPDDVYSSSHHSATIVSGRRPPSPGVRFADEHATRARSRSRPRDNPARQSAGQNDWKRMYERELAEQQELERNRGRVDAARKYPTSPDRNAPTSRGLDVQLNTDRVKGTLSLGRDRQAKKEKRDNDLAWSSDEDSEDDKKRERERESRKKERERGREQREQEREKERDRDRDRDLRERERERELQRERERAREIEIAKERERERIEKENRRRSGHYTDAYGDPRRSTGQLQQQDPRRSAGTLATAGAVAGAGALALVSAHEADRIKREKAEKRRSGYYEESTHYGDPRRSTGQIHDPRRSAGALPLSAGPRSHYDDDPRKSGGHIVRYEQQDQYYRRESPPSADDIAAGVRYVQRPLSPPTSSRPSSTQYLVTEQPGGRQRASSVGHRRGPSLNTELARMTLENRQYQEQYDDYTPDTYRPTYYPLSPMPSPGLTGRDRGFNVDVGGNFSLGSPMGGANLGYSAHASSSHGHGSHHRSRSSTRGDYIRPEEKRRPVEPKYDPKDHAQILYKALKGKVADVGAIVKIIPLLSGEQIVALRAEYKRIHPLGNVNLAKHLKAQLSGKIQLAAYVTALGPYESESYWATLSNQKPNFRHALLIEALMGRENDDIMDMKDSYRDAKNDNNFEKAITKELTADKGTNEKFKELVLTQLDAQGMNEWDKVYLDKVRDDAEDIHDALLKDKVDSLVVGNIIITRSTTHVREMMRLYKKLFNQDLARLIAEKITGLIGEALLHVLNGVLNKPARDARLLEESMKGVGTRDDLLVARLVRIHWDPDHMAAVKEAYKAKYNMSLKERIQSECSGSYQEFLINLIQVDTHTTAVVKH